MDLFFSNSGGFSESRHVYIDGNDLIDRWKNLKEGNFFTIGELGFGAGLNFLSTWKAWSETDYKNKDLYFYSIDKNPLKIEDAKQVISKFKELKSISDIYFTSYPINCKGAQRISFPEYNIHLTLHYSDIIDSISSINSHKGFFDAWFLDGFSPDRNPEMWSKEIFKVLKKKSHAKTSFSTFSSSNKIRNHLLELDATVNSKKGFANKKYMTNGVFNSRNQSNNFKKKSVAIVGAGIAGCSLAHSLVKRGHKCTIFDQNKDLCGGASGNLALISYPRLSAFDSPFSKFSAQSFIYSTQFYEKFASKGWHKTGVLFLDTNDFSKKRIEDLIQEKKDNNLYRPISADEASTLSGTNINHNGLFFPSAGWIEPIQLCQDLINDPNIEVFLEEKVLKISHENFIHNLISNKKNYNFDEICLCNSFEAENLISIKGTRIKRGQITYIPTNKDISKLKMPICGKGYISPLINDKHLVGATYSDNKDMIATESDSLENLQILYDIFPDIHLNPKTSGEKVGLRATTIDHLPIAGKSDNFYLNIGHGSRGSTSAPLCGEYIADLITGSPLPLDIETMNAISIKRFNSKS